MIKDRKAPKTMHGAAIHLLSKKGGLIRTSEAINAGVHPRSLYYLRDSGFLEQISRGVYRLSGQEPMGNPDLAIVAVRIPKAVICLVSALAFHEISTQIPHRVEIALATGAESPRIDYPPISIHRFSGASLMAGIEEHLVDGVVVRVYSPEKTLADCFKFRNKLGMDVVIEALRLYKTRMKFNIQQLLKYARICRVENVIKPYLEAIV